MRQIILPFTIVFAVSFFSPFANGQDQRRTQRRQLVEDLLRGLIESQMDNPNQPNARPSDPNRPLPGQPPTNQPGIAQPVSRDMLSARKHLQDWNSTCTHLVNEIRHHEYEAPQLRPLLADALKIQASMQLLSLKAQRYPTVAPLVNEFGAIDRDWRVLSHRLKQTRGLPTACAGFVNTISDLDNQLCGLFKIQPQIDRRELTRLATVLSSNYDNLLQNVYFVARSKPGGTKLIKEGQALQSRIGQATALIPRGDYDSIANAYQRCMQDWKTFSRKIQSYRDERLQYAVREIETTGKQIYEQLWLPVELDRQYLAGLTDAVAADTTRMFDSISISQLLACKQPGNALAAAREFQLACGNFSRGISSGAPIEDLEWDYRLFDVQWNQVHSVFHELKITAVDHQLDNIQLAMDTLKQTFGEATAMDRTALLQIAASLDALCQQNSRVIHRLVDERQYDQAFHENICGHADRMSQTVSGIYRRIIQQPNNDMSRRDFDSLFVQWRSLKPLMAQCKPEHQSAFSQYRRQIEPLMVKLQVVFAE